MARQGDVIENPETGERIEFERTDRGPGRDDLSFEYSLRPGGFALGKVDHVHPRQEEYVEVRSGRLGVRIDGDEWTATPGTRFAIPPETAHTLWNDGTETVTAAVELVPALDSETFLRTTFALAADGKATDLGLPGPLRLAVLADEFSEEFAVARVPLGVQRAAASALAPVGRLAGYSGEYSPDDERRAVIDG